jgi:hypothetical protein
VRPVPLGGASALLCTLALLPAAATGAASAASTQRVDGISDQGLATWDGAFDLSALGGALRPRPLLGQSGSGLTLARYAVQWDALLPEGGSTRGTASYGPRFEAWLTDAAALGLRLVLALTSYNGVHPDSTAAYATGLRALLARALALGHPIAFLEPWNEPNGQGHAPAATAAAYADAAAPVCAGAGCTVIAGDFEDRAGSAAYARAYVRSLASAPDDWGVHPYVSVATHELAPVLALKAALPGGGAGLRTWITEVAALRCRHGEVLGDGRQAQDAAFLVDTLAPDPAIAPVHVLYYGLLAPARTPAPCSHDGGEDGELFNPDGTPRPAAEVVFPQLAGARPAAAFGPGPEG